MGHQHGEHPGAAGTDRARDDDVHDDADDPDDLDDGADDGDDAGRVPGTAASWLVVAVAAAPPLVLGEVARRYLSGAADRAYFGGTDVPEADVAALDLGGSARFGLLWMTVPVPQVLLASLPGLLVLCALVVAGRPGWLVPGRWGRRLAAGAAALTAAESLLVLVTLLVRADDPEGEVSGNGQITYYVPPTGHFPELAPVLALLAVAAVLAALAALVLWRGGGPGPAVAEPDLRPDPDPGPDPAPVPGPGPAGVPEDAVAEETGVHDVPRPSAAELDAYRRPGG